MRDEPALITSGPAVAQAGLVHRVRPGRGPGPHPTVVMIHGYRGNEDVTWVFARAVPADWLAVSPRAMLVDEVDGYTWHSPHPVGFAPLAAFDDAVAAVRRFVDALPALYEADPERVYFLGFSQGAATAVATLLAHPDVAQGVAALVGFVPADIDERYPGRPLAGRPVFMAAGRDDQTIPLEIAEASAGRLRAAGADLNFHVYDTGHKLNAAGMRDLTAWWAARAAAI